jgi:GNAT superfamily N-acetyltransferase
MRAADAAEVARFYQNIRRDTVPVIHSVEDIGNWLVEARIPRGSSYVLEQEGRLLGWLDVVPGELDQLYLRRGSTGQGLGKLLLEFAKRQSPAGLELYTFQVNSGARRFYAREGFVEIEWGDGNQNEEGRPDVKMSWPGTR